MKNIIATIAAAGVTLTVAALVVVGAATTSTRIESRSHEVVHSDVEESTWRSSGPTTRCERHRVTYRFFGLLETDSVQLGRGWGDLDCQ